MISALLISSDRNFFSGFESFLDENDITHNWAGSGTKAIAMIMGNPVELLMIDEELPDMTGRQFVEKTIILNPMVNCVVASPLTKKEFNEVYEGFGILMQLTVRPGRKEAQKIIDHVKKILCLTKSGEENR